MISNNNKEVLLSPYQVELNTILTVRTVNDSFSWNSYIISDESGKLIRKGTIEKGICEFKLCIVGFKTGEYCLTIGKAKERFSVI